MAAISRIFPSVYLSLSPLTLKCDILFCTVMISDLSLENFLVCCDDDEVTVKMIDYGLMESRDDGGGGDLRCTQRVGKMNYS